MSLSCARPAIALRRARVRPPILPIMDAEYSSHSRARTPATSILDCSPSSTSGNRTRCDTRPKRLNAYLSGTGFGSRNSAAVSCASASARRCALAISPCRHARNMFRQRPGAALDVTEMQPSPPCARKPKAAESSPQRSLKSAPTRGRKRAGRAMSPLASLSPITCGTSANRATVSSASGLTLTFPFLV